VALGDAERAAREGSGVKGQQPDYRWIRIWGRRMGSLFYYIEGQIERARETNAPADAIFERFASDGSGRTGTWATMSELAESNPALHAELTATAERA